jgi:hypothetical protein
LQLAYDRPEVGDVDIEVFPIVTVGYGFANGEIGVSYHNVKGYTAVKGANAKYVLVKESDSAPGLAVGVMYLSANTSETDVYLVASGIPGAGDELRTTVGLLYQKPNEEFTDSHLTGMIGLEFGAPGKTTVGFDYVFKDIAAGNTGGAIIRHAITPDITMQFGVGSRARYFFGMTMKFGGN